MASFGLDKKKVSKKNDDYGMGHTKHPGVSSGVPYRTVHIYISHPPVGRFSMLDMSTVGIVPLLKRSALAACRGELCEGVSFGIGTAPSWSQSKQSSLGNRPTGV